MRAVQVLDRANYVRSRADGKSTRDGAFCRGLSDSGQEVQGGDVVGPYDGEVASIEGGHVTD